ncbi:MAG: molybdopterin-dependent oxidoreductase [Micrococcales bacterium]|nr:molybdopterin-dependent oxidoreductase [Micrococcales bacterium]
MQRLLWGIRQSLRAPSRNPRSAVVLGRLLGAAFLITFVTGLFSHFIQNPLPGMRFLTRPVWLYQVSQGIHITAGILCFPLILAKLYAVYPRLFQTPPLTGFRNLLERASIALFVAASLVEITTGMLNTYQWYQLFPFPFRQTHYALAFVVVGSLAIHIAVKLPIIARYWRRRDALDASGEVAPLPVDLEDGDDTAGRRPLPAAGITGRIFAWVDGAPQPERPHLARRGFFAAVGAAGAAVVALTAGQSFRALDALNVFAPRKAGVGPATLPVNRTAAQAGVSRVASAPDWVLTVRAGQRSRTYTRAELAALPQHDVDLPIACVEGWSQMARWRGPRLRDLMDAVQAPADAFATATSLQKGSIYAVSRMEPEFARDPLTLVALELNGETLDLDHGYPARLIAPARPGVLQTKWLSRIEAT